MNQNGLREMEKRAETVGSSWHGAALLAIGVAIARVIWRKVNHLLVRQNSEGQSPDKR
jgi:hypothetical protein